MTEADNNFHLKLFKLGLEGKKSKKEDFDSTKLAEKLEKIDFPQIGGIPLKSITLDEVKEKTKQIVSVLYKGVGLKVDIFKDELKNTNPEIAKEYQRSKALFDIKKLNKAGMTENMLRAYKRLSKKGSVFDIPVYTVAGVHSMAGDTNKGPLFICGDAVLMAKKAPVYMESITLGGKCDLLSIGTYLHEITHALIDRHKGVVENFYNDEFLSIFMEKVAVDCVDTSPDKFLVKCSEVYRLAYTKEQLLKANSSTRITPELLEELKYIQSSLYAGILFDRYSKLDDQGRQAILDQIRLVLNGREKVNDIINNQKLSLENDEVFEYIAKVARYTIELNAMKDKVQGTMKRPVKQMEEEER